MPHIRGAPYDCSPAAGSHCTASNGETQADVARSYNVGATTIGRLQAAA
jgi:hypothetical protein